MRHTREPWDDFAHDELDDGQDLGTAIAEQLQSTPWWALSISLHLLVVVGVLPLIDCRGPLPIKPIEIVTRLDVAPEPPLEEKKPQTDDAVDVPDPEVPEEEATVDTPHPPQPEPETDQDNPERTSQGNQGQAPDNLANSACNLQNVIGPARNAGKMWGNRGNGGMTNGGPHGATRRTQTAVGLGLDWLKRHQSPSGRWDADGFQARCADGVCTGAGHGWTDPGLTGLATLAFLGAGHTHRFGRHKEVVGRALRWMIKVQRGDGLVGAANNHYMYNHAICALALAEAYGMTRSPLLRSAATRAVDYLVKARNDHAAWRYRYRSGDDDVSVTGWVVMALKSARAAELKVPGLKAAIAASGEYIERLTDDSYYITGYRKRPPRGWNGPTGSRVSTTVNTHIATHSPTAIATMTRVFLGYPRSDARLQGGAQAVASLPPAWQREAGGQLSTIDYYYWYYGTLAMFQMGGDLWKTWNKHMKAALVDHQERSGCHRGSWPVAGPWCGYGGRVYATAINVLTLEIYYRYPRIFS